MKLEIEIFSATVVPTTGSDKIYLKVAGPSPFPELERQKPGAYPLTLEVSCRSGYAEEWLRQFGCTCPVEVVGR